MGCQSAATAVTVDAQPVTPVAPVVASVTQPTCTIATGTITLTTVSGVTYKLNGATASAGPFTLLAAGTYSITAVNATCESSPISVTVNAQPATPSALALTDLTISQPTCAVATGSISVTAPVSGLEYKLDLGAYSATGIFASVAVGTHTITVRNAAGCESAALSSITINAQPSPPASPTVASTVQPTCIVATGTITVTTVSGLEYKLDGGAYQSSGVFAGVASGAHTITAKNALGCQSSPKSVVINAQPASAQSPTITGSATVCTGETLNLTATGVGTYAWNGPNAFNETTAAISLPNAVVAYSGTYTVTVTNANGCTANATTLVTVNAVPITPTVQANVNIPAGTSTTLTATGCAGTLLWFNTANNSSVTMPISPTATTTYYAKCTVTANSVTCIGQASGNVVVTVGPMVIISIKTGSWEDPTTWNVGRLPLVTENVTIDISHIVTITNTNATAKKIIYKLGAKLNFGNVTAKLTLGSL